MADLWRTWVRIGRADGVAVKLRARGEWINLGQHAFRPHMARQALPQLQAIGKPAMILKFLPVLAAAVSVAAVPAEAGQRRDPEQQIANVLRDRVAGEPVDCINLRNVRSSQVIANTAILYDAGGTIYVNRPRAGADALDNFSAQVVRPFNTRLCTVDTVQMIDQTTGHYRGTVFLGEFVPYRRADRD